jgi:putative endonuclease
MTYTVYILQSEKDNGYYVGLTSNLDKRLEYHNKKKVRSTKNRGPWKIAYKEVYSTRSEARDREKYLKSYKGVKEKFDILKK